MSKKSIEPSLFSMILTSCITHTKAFYSNIFYFKCKIKKENSQLIKLLEVIQTALRGTFQAK